MISAPRWLRRSLRSARLHAALCWTIHLYIRFVYATNRWTVVGEEWPRQLCREGRGFIVAFWHGRLLMLPYAWPQLAPFHMLISAHRDGRIIADAVGYFGIHSVPGSTRRGGSAALRRMLKQLEAGECVGITPDGPRGPATVASVGIVNLARLAGAPIVPVVFATSYRKILNSWDRFNLALPFGRGVFVWGEPIEIASDLDDLTLAFLDLVLTENSCARGNRIRDHRCRMRLADRDELYLIRVTAGSRRGFPDLGLNAFEIRT